MHRSRIADDLLVQMVHEKKIDMLILSEHYKDKEESNWYVDNLGTAALWIPQPSTLTVEDHGKGDGFVWVRIGGATYVSCYLTPNEPIAQFELKLEALEDMMRGTEQDVLLAGDVNAKAAEWGMGETNPRGARIMDMAARLGLVVINQGNVPTFRRAGCQGTIPDVTMAMERMAARVRRWNVMEDFTGSDHQYIEYEVVNDGVYALSRRGKKSPGWNAARTDKHIFTTLIALGIGQIQRVAQRAPGGSVALDRVGAKMALISKACSSSMPRKAEVEGRRPAYWWNNHIAELRRVCLRARRCSQRTPRGSPQLEARNAEYRAAKKRLKQEIGRSKAQKWKELQDDIDNDPWGLGYRIVTKKLRGMRSGDGLTAEMKDAIVEELFPQHPIQDEGVDVNVQPEPIPFTAGELRAAVKAMRTKKAPGPDGIPTEALKMVADTYPDLLLDMYNACLKEGIFPGRWKKAKLMLLSKGKGDPRSASAYRPLCLLDTAGKLYEKLLKPRIQAAVADAGGLSRRQYGFIPGRSTIDAIAQVVSTAKSLDSESSYSRRLCLLVTLDVRNAFNSARWNDILGALRDRFSMPAYLYRVLRDYLRDRWLLYSTDSGDRAKLVTAGAAQGSVLGADLWNVNYDAVLEISMPEDVFLVGYADDLAAVVVDLTLEGLQMKLNQVMRRVHDWMDSHALSLAVQKTEVVLLTRKHVEKRFPVQVIDQVVSSSPAVKYLGVVLDCRLNFGDHIRSAANKASAVVANLSRLMVNVGGPSPIKRRLLMRTAEAVMLYGAEIWAEALRFQQYREILASVQRRGALRIISAYRTVSGPAALVIAGTIPVHLLALERGRQYEGRRDGVPTDRKAQREASMRQWQQDWRRESRGRWTARLIPDLSLWAQRKHGEVNYFTTMFLTGHGYFRSYLKKIGKADSPRCLYCDAPAEDAEHTFFVCERWGRKREALEIVVGPIDPDNIVHKMLEKQEWWEACASFYGEVLRAKKVEEGEMERREES
ncbi:Reverse transcriptase (RNA-dependent DNA polymerase) [Nesidiocoris tenuis]|uniref:Reverse transcriptase (RNA-dependent DNA polymerase) n=1 Tax=Nesidiocoris tenuis TaxID=355587 RepID=A0ABN7AEQ3_9HEMI|nr:Reverse transcriptase (RNA-dependent DNA polymerase) [Nesidiocoris tenuis]